jgi:5'-methylthioadenosine phosphorylase
LSATRRPRLGIIGGSGLYALASSGPVERVEVATPFGAPSDAVQITVVEGREVAILARHGAGHRLLPSEINYRANVYAMKLLGVERILSASAVGSMREEIRPRDVVLPDQFIDRTRGRAATFFGGGIAAHVAFADPVCPEARRALVEASRHAGAAAHDGGTYLCMEGPAFSTRAESLLYRSWGVHVIGMTNLTEAKLAREAEICYATLALVTDYDCWHPAHDSVTVDMIIANLVQNAKTAQQVIANAVERLPVERTCECARALATAIITRPDAMPAATKEKLKPIIGKYL